MHTEGNKNDEQKNITDHPYYRTKYVRDDGDWLQAGVPSLHLCHSNRPWARVLQNIIHPQGVL